MLTLTLETLGMAPPSTNDEWLTERLERLFQSLEPGEVFTVSGPQLVACLEAAIQQGVIKPRLSAHGRRSLDNRFGVSPATRGV